MEESSLYPLRNERYAAYLALRYKRHFRYEKKKDFSNLSAEKDPRQLTFSSS